SEEHLLTITEDEARKLFAQPKTRGRQAAKAPLKEFGDDPISGKPIVLKDGRFGPYVTDGEYNASLRKDDDVESVTAERAQEFLSDRRAKAPAKESGKKSSAKKGSASTKKTTTSTSK